MVEFVFGDREFLAAVAVGGPGVDLIDFFAIG